MYSKNTWKKWNAKQQGPVAYYFLLRQIGYKPRSAWASCLMWFCPSKKDLKFRMNRTLAALRK